MTAPRTDPLRFMASEDSALGVYEFVGRWFPASGSLLDVGCGSGGFLRYARGRGLRVRGIDSDEGNVAACSSQGLDAVAADAFDALSAPDNPYDVVSLIHLVEHFPPADATRLIELAATALAERGILIVVTPNFADPTVSGHIFWLDPTHVRPYPLTLLEDICAAAGLETVFAGTEVLVELGRRRALLRPLQRLRHGREYERCNAILVARRPTSTD